MSRDRGEREGGERPRAYDAAVRLLAPRSLTVREIRDRLARRGYPPAESEEAIAALLTRGYLDDRALAYNVAAILAERRLYGRTRVVAELARRGVASDAIDEAVDRAFAQLDEDVMARKAVARVRVVPDDRRSRERAARALLRRGFSRGAVARALGSHAPATGEPGESEEESEDILHDDFEADS